MIIKKIFISGNPSLSTGNATDSICPYGWQLAENETESKKSFSNLTNAYLSFSSEHNSAAYSSGLRSDITLLSFLRSGYYNGSNDGAGQGRPIRQGTYGYYWSLFDYSSTRANCLHFFSTTIYPQYSGARRDGFAVRCLAR